MDRARSMASSQSNMHQNSHHHQNAHGQQSHQQHHRQQMQHKQQTYDTKQHFHISERPMNSLKYMDKKPRSILCNSSGIVVAEMVYRCLICKSIFETPLDCRSHFRCFHQQQPQA